MLPADSAIAAVLRPHEPEAPKPTGSWGDLAKSLATSEGMRKGSA